MAVITNEYLYYQFPDAQIDVARMGSYVISGIGFLGAGSIIKDGFRVRGLTTAAGLWVVACLGLAAGAGFYQAALIGGGTVVVVLVLLKAFEGKFVHKRNRMELEMRIKNVPGQLAKILSVLGTTGVRIKDISIKSNEEEWIEVVVLTTYPNGVSLTQLRDKLDKDENIVVESIEFMR